MSKNKAGDQACPCGGKHYATCCQPYHDGGRAETAEQLMRSRYSAYVNGLWDYVYRTWDERTRPALAELQSDKGTQWLGLEVKRHEVTGSAQGDEAIVEFVARYKINGRAHRLHEVSRFTKQDGNWTYIEGSFPETTP